MGKLKTLIAYSTKYGCTENCAKVLADKISGTVVLHNLKESTPNTIEDYDSIIIGGSIYMGQIQKEVTEFCTKNLEIIKSKRIGLFVCCMREGETAENQLNTLFPKELLEVAIAKDYFGGAFAINKMSFMDKLIAKVIAKTNKDTSKILNESINKFSGLMN